MGARWSGSKKSKHIPTLPRGAGLKSYPILVLSPLQGGENPHTMKWGRVGLSGVGQNCYPYTSHLTQI